MSILNAMAAILAILLLFGIWGGVHLLARRVLGDRKLGCRGPVVDEAGNRVCCKNPEEACESDTLTPRQTPPGPQ